jgi:hypothetical protein
VILLISASWVVKISHVSHRHLPLVYFYLLFLTCFFLPFKTFCRITSLHSYHLTYLLPQLPWHRLVPKSCRLTSIKNASASSELPQLHKNAVSKWMSVFFLTIPKFWGLLTPNLSYPQSLFLVIPFTEKLKFIRKEECTFFPQSQTRKNLHPFFLLHWKNGLLFSSCCMLGPILIHYLEDLCLWNVLSHMYF